jgi:hypothetical protein
LAWQHRFKEMLLAGGAVAVTACGSSSAGSQFGEGDATASDVTTDVTMGFDANFCCNADPDPCCQYLNCGGGLTTECSEEMACQADGGVWNPYPGGCSHEAGAFDAESSDAAGDSPSDGGANGNGGD